MYLAVCECEAEKCVIDGEENDGYNTLKRLHGWNLFLFMHEV